MFRQVVAIGDPQAPLSRFLAILDARGLLRSGRLKADVRLVSMGDHFDWGPPEARREATADGTALLSWLASHSPEQVVLLLGNHDTARVCELAAFETDAAFAEARQRADEAYRRGNVDAALERELLAEYPFVPDAECLARDFSCFAVEQRELVTELLHTKRFRLAFDHEGLLLVHAGVTLDDLSAIGVQPKSAAVAAQGLNAFLDRQLAKWNGGALDLEPFHQPGDAKRGSGRGALFHRPGHPEHSKPADVSGPPRRRFDPRRLPDDFPQAIGHIRDKKCRETLGPWSDAGPAVDGPLRTLRIAGNEVEYRARCLSDARLYFLDGGMAHTSVEAYQLLDLDTRLPLGT